MSYDEVIGDTLALVNVVRQAFGKDALDELPDATPGHAGDCLYARALRDVGVERVGGGGLMSFRDERVAARVAAIWGTQAHGVNVTAPPQFGEVIGHFDGHRLPHYHS